MQRTPSRVAHMMLLVCTAVALAIWLGLGLAPPAAGAARAFDGLPADGPRLAWQLESVSVYQQAPAVAVWRIRGYLPSGLNRLTLSPVPNGIEPGSIVATVEAGHGEITAVTHSVADRQVQVQIVMPEWGEAAVRLIYTFPGLTWSASYSARVDGAGEQVAFHGWRRLTNTSGVDLPPTMVQIVAGPSNHLGQMAQYRGGAELKHTSIQVPLRQGLPDGAEILTPIASLSQVPARLLHVLDRIPLTAQETGAPREQVQAALGLEIMLPADGQDVSYPLPAGELRVYSCLPDGSTFLLGKDVLQAAAGAGPVIAVLDPTPALRAEKWRTDQRRIGTGSVEEAYQIKLLNYGAYDAQVLLIEAFPGDWTILQSTPVVPTRNAEGMAQFTLTVRAGERVELLYRVRYTQ